MVRARIGTDLEPVALRPTTHGQRCQQSAADDIAELVMTEMKVFRIRVR
jgi:hypothetical protein